MIYLISLVFLYTSSELENGLARAQRELKEAEARKTQLEREVDNSRMEKERALIDLDAARLQVQKKKILALLFSILPTGTTILACLHKSACFAGTEIIQLYLGWRSRH